MRSSSSVVKLCLESEETEREDFRDSIRSFSAYGRGKELCKDKPGEISIKCNHILQLASRVPYTELFYGWNRQSHLFDSFQSSRKSIRSIMFLYKMSSR